MKFHGLGPIGAKAIAKTLEVKNIYEVPRTRTHRSQGYCQDSGGKE